jgi:hypothetical protein
MDAQEAAAKENYDWFQDHLSELEKQYEDEYLVIKDRAVIGAYSSYRDAFENVRVVTDI